MGGALMLTGGVGLGVALGLSVGVGLGVGLGSGLGVGETGGEGVGVIDVGSSLLSTPQLAISIVIATNKK